MLAADHAVFLKQIIKAAALASGFDATFMAKPYPDRAGTGLHVHVSVLDEKRPQHLRRRFGRGIGRAALTPSAACRR